MGKKGVKVALKKVEICDLRNNTYYALIYITYNGKEISIDARPSDALAIALRVNAPIFAAEEVIEKSQQIILSQAREGSSKR